MNARRFVESALVVAVMAVAFSAAGAGTARAQEIPPCEGETCPPPPPPPPDSFPPGCESTEGAPDCVCEEDGDAPQCPAPGAPPTCIEFGFDPDGEGGQPASCTSEIALFTPENDSWTYVFDANNSIKISTQVSAPFVLKVDRLPIDQATYQDRVAGTPFEGSTCHPTLIPGVQCNFYKVHGEFVPRDSYGELVEYIVGFLEPGVQGNKHDWMLLRAPGERYVGDPVVPFSFCQEITTKVIRHYIVPELSVPDPGVGGVALGMSDYIVAHQRLRPASAKKRAEGQCPEPLPTAPPGG